MTNGFTHRYYLGDSTFNLRESGEVLNFYSVLRRIISKQTESPDGVPRSAA